MFPQRSRPARLSNRNCCYSNEDAAAVDAKDIADLAWPDYELIFTLSGCTAEYEEQLYYLPHALRYVKEHPDEADEVLAGLVYFISSPGLERDGLLAPALAALRDCFTTWTETFTVGRVHDRDYVERSETVRELIDALLRYGRHEWADELVESWISPGHREEDSAWFLEYAKEGRQEYASSRIRVLIFDDALLQREYDRIKDTLVAREPSPTYWPGLIAALGLYN